MADNRVLRFRRRQVCERDGGCVWIMDNYPYICNENYTCYSMIFELHIVCGILILRGGAGIRNLAYWVRTGGVM
mgnify:CR=1 FL=1